MRSVRQFRDRPKGVYQIRASCGQWAESIRVDWNVKMNPPGGSAGETFAGPLDQRFVQVSFADDFSIQPAGDGLMEVAWFDVTKQSRTPLGVASGIIQLNGAAQVDLVDPYSGGIQVADGSCDILKFDGLMTDVVTEADVRSHGFFGAHDLRYMPKFFEKTNRFTCGFENAERLGLDSQPDKFAGLLV